MRVVPVFVYVIEETRKKKKNEKEKDGKEGKKVCGADGQKTNGPRRDY